VNFAQRYLKIDKIRRNPNPALRHFLICEVDGERVNLHRSYIFVKGKEGWEAAFEIMERKKVNGERS